LYIFLGTLSVVSVDQSNKSSQLWYISGDQGPAWNQASMTIGDSQMTSDYVVQFIATLNTIVNSDISIDDISTVEGSCLNTNKPPSGL